MKRVLVTGGMGYIGSHTIVELMRDRIWDVYSIDNLINSKLITAQRIHKLTGKKIKNFKVNLCNLNKLRSIFRQLHPIHGIIHFGALKSVDESVEQPIRYYHNNINSLLNILSCCHEFKVCHFIFSSSCSIYGNLPISKQPVNEDTPTSNPTSPYAHSKSIGEGILKQFYPHVPMKAVSLRYFNPAGSDFSGLLGEDPSHMARNLVNVITHVAAKNLHRKKKEAISIYGNDYPTRDGTCIRDYIHVCDIARAHVDALYYLGKVKKVKEGHYEVFNLSTGKGITVLEMVKAFEKISGITLKKSFCPRRSGDVVSIYSNNQKSHQILNWSPQYGIEDMVGTAWKWELNKLNEKKR